MGLGVAFVKKNVEYFFLLIGHDPSIEQRQTYVS